MSGAGDDALTRLLAGRFPDPDGPDMLRVATRLVAIAPNFNGQEADLLQRAGLRARHWAVVSDMVTWSVLGARVESALPDATPVTSVVLDTPHADMDTVAEVRARTRDADVLIAVGSGTINDLCKYAAYLDDKPYAVFGTAPSMNGYTSPTAAITEHGHKHSLPAAAAQAVLLPLDILAQAPVRLIRSGLGDSLCRSTAQADWLLAHLVRGEPYRQAPFALLQDDEAPLFAAAASLVRGDREAMGRLARTLVLSGFGMAICGSSQPASQGEHLVSHYMDMMGDGVWPAAYHGEQIGVTTLTLARLQERILEAPAPRLQASSPTHDAMMAWFGPTLGESCWDEFARKRLDDAHAAEMSWIVAQRWPEIRARIGAIRCPARALEEVLRQAGAPTSPKELGWPDDIYRQAVLHAREIRNRWTFLDLAADSAALSPSMALASA